MDIVIIGTGNTATVLGKKIKAAGHRIVQVFGRNKNAAVALSEELHSASATTSEELYPGAELYILAVSDNAVGEVAQSLSLTDKTVVHTAASVSIEVLKGHAKYYGVFYPLQSMKKSVKQLPEMPLLLAAGDDETLQRLKILAAGISENVLVAGDSMRLKMHLAAVMVNNFTNHLFTLVEQYCRNEELPFSLFVPLLKEIVSRLEEVAPSEAQTGPAVRNDTVTITKHLALLESAPELKKFYELFTESIKLTTNRT